MLAIRIIATVLLGISVITGIFKNICCEGLLNEDNPPLVRRVALFSLWSVLWRAFVIVSIWILQGMKFNYGKYQ